MHSLDTTLVFLTVCEEGSFLAAGQSLGLATSTVSRRVSQLEARLGVALFERSTHGLTLTEAGRVYRDATRGAPELLEHAADAVRAVMRTPSGRLRIAAPSELVRTTLAPAVIGFARQYPDVSLELIGTDQDVDPDGDELHLAVRVTRTAPPPHLRQRKLGLLPMTICAAPEYLARTGPITWVADLAERPCVVLGSAPGAARIRMHGPAGVEEVSVPIALFTTSVGLARQAGVEGIGPVGLPSPVCRPLLDSGALVELLPGFELEPVPVVLLYAGERQVPFRVRAFIELLVSTLADGTD